MKQELKIIALFMIISSCVTPRQLNDIDSKISSLQNEIQEQKTIQSSNGEQQLEKINKIESDQKTFSNQVGKLAIELNETSIQYNKIDKDLGEFKNGLDALVMQSIQRNMLTLLDSLNAADTTKVVVIDSIYPPNIQDKIDTIKVELGRLNTTVLQIRTMVWELKDDYPELFETDSTSSAITQPAN